MPLIPRMRIPVPFPQYIPVSLCVKDPLRQFLLTRKEKQTGTLGQRAGFSSEPGWRGCPVKACMCTCTDTIHPLAARINLLRPPAHTWAQSLEKDPAVTWTSHTDLQTGLPGAGPGPTREHSSQLPGTTLPLGGYGPAPVVYSSAAKNRGQLKVNKSHFPQEVQA